MPRKLHDWHSAHSVYAELDLQPPVELAVVRRASMSPSALSLRSPRSIVLVENG